MSLNAKKTRPQYEQHKNAATHLKLLLKKNVSTLFHNKYEGGNSIVILVLVTSHLEVIKQINEYLLNKFGIDDKDPFVGNHSGPAMKRTRQINFSELTPEIIAKINHEYEKIFHAPVKKISIVKNNGVDPIHLVKASEVPFSSKPGSLPEYLKPEAVVKERIPRDPANRCRISATALLMSMFEFENKFLLTELDHTDLISYNNVKDNNCQIIHCASEEVSKKVELALFWLSGNPKVVVRDSKDIMVNFTKMALTKQNPINITYCLPPDKHLRVSEMETRLKRVCFGAKPKVKIVGIEEPSIMDLEKRYEVFKVSYTKKYTSIKIYELLNAMGWNTRLLSDGELIIHTDPNVDLSGTVKINSEVKEIPQHVEEKNEPNVSLTSTLSVEKKETHSTELVEVKGDNVNNQREIKKDPVVVKKREHFTPIGNNKMSASIQVSTPVVLSDEDALYEAKVLELKTLRSNTRVFLKLPVNMQREIDNILFKEEHIIDEAISLLSFFKK